MLSKRDYPREILVGDTIYSIRFVKYIAPRTRTKKTILAECDPANDIIQIRQDLGPEQRLEAFFHELLHAFEYEYGIAVPHAWIYKVDGYLAKLVIDNLSPSYLAGVPHTDEQSPSRPSSPKREAATKSPGHRPKRRIRRS